MDASIVLKHMGFSGPVFKALKGLLKAFKALEICSRWFSRRLRSHFEDWMRSNEGLGDQDEAALQKIWSLVCTEVVMRRCRDIVMTRTSKAIVLATATT